MPCGDCPCEFDAAGDLSAAYMQTMFEQLSPLCPSAATTETSSSRVLMIGLGGAELPQYLLHHCPDMVIEAAEISANVINISRAYFGLAESEETFGGRIAIDHSDALAAVRSREAGEYDAVLVDCFVGSGEVPEDCRSQQFAEGVRRLLRSGGHLLQNMWHKSPGHQHVAADFREAVVTYSQVFGRRVADLSVPMPPQVRWVDILVATKT